MGRRLSLAQSAPQQQSTGAQNAQEITTLESGKPVERELSGGQRHVYQLALAEGQYANVTVEQRGIDLSVQLHGVDGKLIAGFDFESRNQGRENVEFVAEATGNYRLEVAPTLKSAPASRYEIRLEETRAATARDRSLDEATRLFAKAARLYEADNYNDALTAAERASQILEQSSGTDNQAFARAVNLVANLYHAKKDYAKAEPLYGRALEVRERMLDAEHPDVAASYHDMARFYASRGDAAKAETFARRALSIRERVLDRDHFHTALTLLNYGDNLFSEQDYARAEEMYLRAVAILEKSLGDDDAQYANAIHSLSYLHDTTGDFDKAEQLYRRELASREKADGKDALENAKVLNHIARIYYLRGDYDEAEALYERTLDIYEKRNSESDILTALANQALIHSARGDYQRGEDIFREVLERREKAANPNQIMIAHTLLNLGVINNSKGDHAAAEQYLKRSLSKVEAIGYEGRGLADIFTTLAGTYIGKGDYAAAEQASRRALAIYEKINGPNHPYVADALNRLGRIAYLKDNSAAAEPLLHRALAIYEKSQGTNTPEVIGPLNGLAEIYADGGDLTRAIEFQNRANTVKERNLALALATGSERQKLNYLTAHASDVDRNLTFSLRQAPTDPKASELAAMTVLRFKGCVLDAMTDTLSALRRRAGPEDKALLDQLNEATSRLARRILNAPRQQVSAENQAQTAALEERREKLEDEISRRSAEFRAQKQPVTLDSIRRAIPEDAALVEFALYRPFDPKASNDRTARGESRYVAYVIRRRGEVRWAELGVAEEIDGAVDALRQALSDSRRKDVRQRAQAVDERLMRPVRALVGDARQLLVSPYGELNLIPFEALVDEQGHYLVERYAFTYLTSGRDLLRMQVASESRSKPTIVANPSFDGPATGQIARVNAMRKPTAPGGRNSSVTAAWDLSEVYFAPLSGTALEAIEIQRLFREANLEVDLLTGARATESALKGVSAPRVLHVATHGFFLQDAGNPTTSNGQVAARGAGASATIENPLLRSGLALAGANLRGGGAGDDGILTALEASGLNLWGTKLVVLSACDTGLGEVRNGEGVYGLRRAFVLAGAESLVMSLWPVSDYSTRGLMTSYYKNLQQGMGRGAALRRVQLDMLRRDGQLHPFYWANFIQSGDWANLDGKRLNTVN